MTLTWTSNDFWLTLNLQRSPLSVCTRCKVLAAGLAAQFWTFYIWTFVHLGIWLILRSWMCRQCHDIIVHIHKYLFNLDFSWESNTPIKSEDCDVTVHRLASVVLVTDDRLHLCQCCQTLIIISIYSCTNIFANLLFPVSAVDLVRLNLTFLFCLLQHGLPWCQHWTRCGCAHYDLPSWLKVAWNRIKINFTFWSRDRVDEYFRQSL